jgi:hypothetical protein
MKLSVTFGPVLRLSLSILLFINFVTAAAAPMCRELFSSSAQVAARFIPDPSTFHPSVLQKAVDAQNIRRFKSPEGSLDLLAKHSKKNENMAHARIADEILFLTLGISFNDIAGVKGAIDFFRNQDNRLLLKAFRGDWQATQNIFQLLTMLSRWINQANPEAPAIDLTSRKDLLRILNLGETETISSAWMRIQEDYYNYLTKDPASGRAQTTSRDPQDQLISMARGLYSRSESKFVMGPKGLGSYLRQKSTTELYDLLVAGVKQLHFPEAIENRHIADLLFIVKNPMVNNVSVEQARVELQISLVRYFNKYVLESRLSHNLTNKELMTSTYAEFARIQILLRQFDAYYKRQEILLEEALVGIETLNVQIAGVEQRLNWAKAETQSLPPEAATFWLERFQRSSENLGKLYMQDLSRNEWLAHKQSFDREHFAIDKLLQEWSRQKQRIDIDFFNQLDFQWELLLPQKAYKIKGLDYQAVVFSAEVIDFFKKNPERGSFFLAALSKGYVAHQNSSGLRKINSIHPDFRDIKLLKHGGKVRIVGRLVASTIHFFFIYDHERPYDTPEMHRLIQRFHAPQL